MAEETEIKCRIEDAGAFRKALKRIGARTVTRAAGGKAVRARGAARVHEMNDLFDTPQGGFAKHGQLVRVRVENAEKGRGKGAGRERVVLTYKGPAMPQGAEEGDARKRLVPAGRHKVREEIEVEVANAWLVTQILEGMGLRRWFRYEKYRTTYRLPGSQRWAKGLLIELDETPAGNYVELEGPAEAIDRAAAMLGFKPQEYITKSYLQLYLEDCRRRGIAPGNMLFESKS
ncbi:MAG: class IV adenylate cyclase [Candidatus Acidiferrales bacterium]|jgi:adenylate cyclase class 2